jgi:hypothetical protein
MAEVIPFRRRGNRVEVRTAVRKHSAQELGSIMLHHQKKAAETNVVSLEEFKKTRKRKRKK